MSNNMGEVPAQPEQIPGRMPDEATLGALGDMIVSGAEHLTRETAQGKPGDRDSAYQDLTVHPTLRAILATAEKIKNGELPPDGRI